MLKGLSPAGHRFVNGLHTLADPDLAKNILSRDQAHFVDVIHTNSASEVCVDCFDRKLPQQNGYN